MLVLPRHKVFIAWLYNAKGRIRVDSNLIIVSAQFCGITFRDIDSYSRWLITLLDMGSWKYHRGRCS